jgi:hypothetical protein
MAGHIRRRLRFARRKARGESGLPVAAHGLRPPLKERTGCSSIAIVGSRRPTDGGRTSSRPKNPAGSRGPIRSIARHLPAFQRQHHPGGMLFCLICMPKTNFAPGSAASDHLLPPAGQRFSPPAPRFIALASILPATAARRCWAHPLRGCRSIIAPSVWVS